jgi:CheY-like chemotaxis protein
MNYGTRYILMLEDDSDDRYITENFFSEQKYDIALKFLSAPDEVMPYLSNCLDESQSLPSLILLDKNFPAGSGLEVLTAIKADARFRQIPVVIVSGSDFADDVDESYRLGANSYIVKPFSNEMTEKKIGTFVKYWFDIAELPKPV